MYFALAWAAYELPPFPAPKALSSSVGTAERAAERNNSSTGSSWDEGNPGRSNNTQLSLDMLRRLDKPTEESYHSLPSWALHGGPTALTNLPTHVDMLHEEIEFDLGSHV